MFILTVYMLTNMELGMIMPVSVSFPEPDCIRSGLNNTRTQNNICLYYRCARTLLTNRSYNSLNY